MTAAAPFFSADEHDVITELVNLGVGKAAGAFSRLVQDEVLLSVPAVEFVQADSAAAQLATHLPDVLAGVVQSFSGFIKGSAALLFPGERSLELVGAVVGADVPPEEIGEFEQETLAEIGNIILNACLATAANVLHQEIHTTLPEAYSGRGDQLLDLLWTLQDGGQAGDNDTSLCMLVQIDFALKARALAGYLAFIIDLHSAEAFREALRTYIASLEG